MSSGTNTEQLDVDVSPNRNGASPIANPSLPSAVFCKQEKWKESIFADRILDDGTLEFGVSEWEKETGHNFSSGGVAKKLGPKWEYKDGEGEEACRITIDWLRPREISIEVDPVANCRSQAGVRFGEKSVRFREADFRKVVTDELGDDEEFMRADPCKESRAND